LTPALVIPSRMAQNVFEGSEGGESSACRGSSEHDQ
jgi:hypothetical protein